MGINPYYWVDDHPLYVNNGRPQKRRTGRTAIIFHHGSCRVSRGQFSHFHFSTAQEDHLPSFLLSFPNLGVQDFTQKNSSTKMLPCYPFPPCYSTPRFPLTPTRRTSQRPTHASHACQWYNAKAWIHRAVEGDVVRWFSLVFQLAISQNLIALSRCPRYPSKIELNPNPNGPLIRKLQCKLLDTQVYPSIGLAGDFVERIIYIF